MAEIKIFDGAMGTLLQEAGMPLGVRPEVFGMENPGLVQEIHQRYINAGAQYINTNTFGANARKLSGSGVSVSDVVKANVKIAKAAAEGKAKVVLDIGPIGDLMEPLGTLSFNEATEIFKEIIIAGADAGADLVVFETMSDLQEVRAGVLAASEISSLPIWVTMSFEADGRTFTGVTAESFALTMESLPVSAYGINCSLGPDEVLPIMERISEIATKPLIAKPNAGLPDPITKKYVLNAESFAEKMKPVLKLGVEIAGGCCGTSPEFIEKLSQLNAQTETLENDGFDGICSPFKVCGFDGVKVIGERINPTGKKLFQQALREGDLNYIKKVAISQEEAGADVLDINVGLPGICEKEMMVAAVKAVQSVSKLPLQIDSADPETIEAGLRACSGRAIVNSVDGTEEKLSSILPLVKKYGAYVVALAMDEKGIPETANERFEIIEKIVKRAEELGINKSMIIADCLTVTISAQQRSAGETLKAVKMVKEKLGLHCTLGVSNISYGLPERSRINTSFLAQAIFAGVDLPIMNPETAEMISVVYACRALNGNDQGCEDYISKFASAPKEAQQAAKEEKLTIESAVLKGLGSEVAQMVSEALKNQDELSIINELLIPALDTVGEKYEKGEIFLPQLINGANAAGEGFDILKASIAKKGSGQIEKGKIILATVQGDIHDIGKNIVKVVLENYGYKIIDLGKDVHPETIVETVQAQNVKLVGLSALMTTTVGAMETTINALKEAGCDCKVMVGGAVLTPEYAMSIGADYYAKDAKQSADIAKEIFE